MRRESQNEKSSFSPGSSGYTGNFDSQRVDGVHRGNTPDDFVAFVKAWPAHQKRIKAEFVRATHIPGPQKQVLQSCLDSITLGTEYVFELRTEDLTVSIQPDTNKRLPDGSVKVIHGVESLWRPGRLEVASVHGAFMTYHEFDEAGSIRRSVPVPFGKKEDAEKHWNDMWVEIRKVPEAKDHIAVQEAWDSIRRQYA